MPPLLLDDEEAIAIAVGLRTAARSSVTGIEETAVRALVKLEQVLPAHLRRRVRAGLGDDRAAARRPHGRPAAPHRDRRGCRDSERLRFAYRAATAPRAGARSSPTRWSTSAAAGTWSPGTAAARTGAPSARPAVGAGATGVRFAPRKLPAKDAAAYVEQSITAGAEPLRGERDAPCAAEEIARRVPAHGARRADRREPCEYRTATTTCGWLALRIAMLGVDFEVHEPPELADHLRALADRLKRAVTGTAS